MDHQFRSRLPNFLLLVTTFYVSGTQGEAKPISQAPGLWIATASASDSVSRSQILHAADTSLPVQRQSVDKATVPSRRAQAEGMTDLSLGGMTMAGARPTLTTTTNKSNTKNSHTMSATGGQIFKKVLFPPDALTRHVPRARKSRNETTSDTIMRTTKPTATVADLQHSVGNSMLSNFSGFVTYRSKTIQLLARSSDDRTGTRSQPTATGEHFAPEMVIDGTNHFESLTVLQDTHQDTPWTGEHMNETSETVTNWKSQDGQGSVPAPGLGKRVRVGDSPSSPLEISMDETDGTLVSSNGSPKGNKTLPGQNADLRPPEGHPAQYVAVLHVSLQMRPEETSKDEHITMLLEQLCLLILSRFTLEDLELRWKAEEKVYFDFDVQDSIDEALHLDHIKNKCKKPALAS